MLTYVIPTHDRPEELAITLSRLGAIDHSAVFAVLGGAEALIVDNASHFPVVAPPKLRNGVPVRVLFRPTNEAAAGRNAGAESARGKAADPNHWLLMLDDDSAPIDAGFVEALAEAPEDVAVVGAEIFLEGSGRESGGLPEVFIGCGAGIRRTAFLYCGGYDRSFGYYAEEYDLTAKLLLAGRRVTWDRRFRVIHRKTQDGRDMNAILRNLVRNNVCVAQRYAPEAVCKEEIARTLERYRVIAEKEGARDGYDRGVADLQAVISAQPRRELPLALYERFTGAAHVRRWLGRALANLQGARVALVDPPGGAVPKHRDMIEGIVRELGVRVVEAPSHGGHRSECDAIVVATLSPGPMLDGQEHWVRVADVPVLTAWSMTARAIFERAA